MELKRRELQVLMEVVRIYIQSGAPVASRQLAESSLLSHSAATLRNVMADLEERGLLSRTHPSAGCLPTDVAFRAYVDALPLTEGLPARAQQAVEQRVSVLRRDLAEDLGWVAQLVADVTSEAGIAVRPMGEAPTLEALSLVPLSDRRVLGVVVTSGYRINKRAFTLEEKIGTEQLQEVATWLNHTYRGVMLDTIREDLEETRAAEEAGQTRPPLVLRAARIGLLLFGNDGENAEIHVAGTDNLLRAEDFDQVERIRSLFSTLSDRAALVREWRRLLAAGETGVLIGRESHVTASGELGMVATPIFADGRRVGALGVVGPRRMDYLRIVPVVEFIGNALTRMLEDAGANHA